MDWISDTIAIGNCFEATDTALHKTEGIRSVLCLDGNPRLRDGTPLAFEVRR